MISNRLVKQSVKYRSLSSNRQGFMSVNWTWGSLISKEGSG